jgi:hypothetical protein
MTCGLSAGSPRWHSTFTWEEVRGQRRMGTGRGETRRGLSSLLSAPTMRNAGIKMVAALQHSPVTCIYVLKELVCDRILFPVRCSPTMS